MDRFERAQLNSNMARLASGDRSAFEAVYVVAAPAVQRLTRRLLRGSPDAEDVAQQALLKVFERASLYDPERPAMPWILGIASWECRTARKKLYRRREVDAPIEVMVCPGESPEEWLVAADLQDALHSAMGQLGPRDLDTLAASMGLVPRPNISGATFRKRLQRAMERLRAVWEAQNG